MGSNPESANNLFVTFDLFIKLLQTQISWSANKKVFKDFSNFERKQDSK